MIGECVSMVVFLENPIAGGETHCSGGFQVALGC